ncbi:riboflavin synthase [Patescibacteria group bacterium]|nr:riboflavin synthase [Patescibacteria group bacterium]
MFTGIIRATTDVLDHTTHNNLLVVTFLKPKGWGIGLGDSIATNGVCLTVSDIGDTTYTAELMEETLTKSSFGTTIPEQVNLETSLTLNSLLDGHIVQGHVDTTGTIIARTDSGGSACITVRISNINPTLVIPKGSITIDGISLTVVDVHKDKITVSLVDYTLDNTIAGEYWQVDTIVNIEYDMIGKYIARYMQYTQN